MTQIGSTDTWQFDMSANNNPYGGAEKVVFSKNGSNTDKIETTLKGTAPKKGWGYTYTLNSSNILYVRLDQWTNNSAQALLWYGDGGYINDQHVETWDNAPGEVSKGYKITVESSYTNVRLHVDNKGETNPADITGWGGQYYRIDDNGAWQYVRDYDASGTGSWSDNPEYVYVPTVSVTQSAAYQPEDRYGFINAVTDAYDKTCQTSGGNNYDSSYDNYITIQTALTDPYIMFYSDDNATTPVGDTSTMETNGISLVKAKINGDTSTADNVSPYKIRLPKRRSVTPIPQGQPVQAMFTESVFRLMRCISRSPTVQKQVQPISIKDNPK